MPTTLLSMLSLSIAAAPAAPSAEAIRTTVQRAIPVIEEGGLSWIEKRDCVTCHRVGNMVWSLGAARQRGFEVADKLDSQFAWAAEYVTTKNSKGKIPGPGNRSGVAQLLIAAEYFDEPKDQPLPREDLLNFLTKDQADDGTWKPGGQLPKQKRPAAETTDVTAMWLAMALVRDEGDHRVQIDKAMQRIEQSKPGKSTEWYAARLLLAKEMEDEAKVVEMAASLRSLQRSDGGWGWMTDDSSEALGTGMALFALHRSGANSADESISRAQAFLVKTQKEDGSWDVHGTKSNKKDEVEETASYWGATWAVLGLIEGLPRPD